MEQYCRDLSRLAIIHLRVVTGHLGRAQRTARSIKTAHYRSEGLVEVATAQSRGHQHDVARETFAEALSAAREIDRSDPGDDLMWTFWIRRIALEQARCGDFAEAIATARQIASNLNGPESLRMIVERLVSAGDFATARRIIEEMEHGDERARAAMSLGDAQYRANDPRAALEAWVNALQFMRPDEWQWRRAEALEEIASLHARAGRFDLADQVVSLIARTPQRNSALIRIAEAQVEAGLAEAGFETLRRVEGERARKNASRELQRLIVRKHLAIQDYESATRAAETIESSYEKSYAIQQICRSARP